MKKLLICMICAALFMACNSNDEKATATNNPVSKEQELKNAVAQYPDSSLLLENLVQYYREGGDYDNAIATINQQLAKDSNNPRSWDIKATLHYEDGDTAQAIRAFEKAIDIIPEPQLIISLGSLYAMTKNPNALVMADALLVGSKAQADKEAYFIKGLYYSYINEKEKAIPFFDKSLAINYSFMDAYREKSIALYDLGRYDEALKVLDKAITLQNNFDEGYYYRGQCLEKLNRPAEAIEEYQKALMYDPEYLQAKDALARLGIKS
ncbi:MAG: tetratricopeptide repeat protein [Sphingobacteriales bacterium]|nr:MAG: tetratricopeptide repeat protein [Sphingobacteriales bacterium]